MKRRDALILLGGAVAGSSLAALTGAQTGTQTGAQPERNPPMKSTRMPVVYLPHGGGPWPFVELKFFDRAEMDHLAAYLRALPAALGVRPKALLVISAHWEAPVATVMTSPKPPMLYDYYGFPPASYEIEWPAPGDPALAARVAALLGRAGFATASDAERGFDHGTFVPLKVSWPEADIPTVQLSLVAGLDPALHIAMGEALAPLRDEGVLIVGSGMSYHDLRGLMSKQGRAISETFDAWLSAAATAEPTTRAAQLAAWAQAPEARRAHPREEHLLPLMVVAGAAGADRGQVGYSGTFGDARISAFHYGA
jgi:aromatic ring-opening dioxygenase catalytic subunit (LigB family)